MTFEPTKLSQSEIVQYNQVLAKNSDSELIKKAADEASKKGVALTPTQLNKFIGPNGDMTAAYRAWSKSWETAAKNNPTLLGQKNSVYEQRGMFASQTKQADLFYIRPNGDKLSLVQCRGGGAEVRFFDGDPLVDATVKEANCPDGDPKTPETKYATAKEQRSVELRKEIGELQKSLGREQSRLRHITDSAIQIQSRIDSGVYRELDILRRSIPDKEYLRYQSLRKDVYDAKQAINEAKLDSKPTGDLEQIEQAADQAVGDFLRTHSKTQAYHNKLYSQELPSYYAIAPEDMSGRPAKSTSDDLHLNFYSYERFPTSLEGAKKAIEAINHQKTVKEQEIATISAEIDVAQQKLGE